MYMEKISHKKMMIEARRDRDRFEINQPLQWSL